MMPGDTNTQALTIANAGTATLRYAMVSAATNVLGIDAPAGGQDPRHQLRDLRRHDHRRPDAPSTERSSATSPRATRPAIAVLTAATNEVLCFQVSLPKATGNALQNTTSAVTFTFSAEQTANNP